MKIIEIKDSNCQEYISIDIVAFSIAYAGAMGEGGGVYIVDSDGQLYHTNFCYGDDHIETEHLDILIPVIKDFQFGVFGSKSNNEEWVSFYTGFGNHLMIKREFYDGFCKKMAEANIQNTRDGQCYLQWPGFILSLLGKEEMSLTMKDISRMRK